MLSSFYRVDHEAQFKQELRVLVLDNDPVAEIKFRTASRPTDGFFLCKLHLDIPVSCIYFFHFRYSVTTETSFFSGELFS